MMQRSARLMGIFMPVRDLFCDWKELDNKLEAFRLFQYAGRELGVSLDALPLEQAVQQALKRDAFRSIWMVEGIGHAKGMTASLSGTGLLSGQTLPGRALIPLHAGLGTAFAERLFDGLPSKPSMGEVASAVERFIEVCQANCSPGWEDATIEPLGLVIRCLHPHLLTPVSNAMDAISPQLRGLFWHGVGRGLYFAPTNFMPIAGAHERMVNGAAAETSSADDRKQVLAGLIWAITLVNLPRPAIVRSFLPLCSQLKAREAFINGVASAMIAWHHMAPEDQRYVPSYTRTATPEDPNAALWNEWIAAPTREAFERIAPGLESGNQIPSIYSYRTPEELLDLSGLLSGAAR